MDIPGKVNVIAVLSCGLLLSGCVMAEKYEAEKARALNFQRLLAQEEKRTGELDSELKRVKRENAELQAQTRELSAQVNAVREQMGRLQEETSALRETAALRERELLGQTRPGTSKGRRAKPAVPKVPAAVPLGESASPPAPAEPTITAPAAPGSESAAPAAVPEAAQPDAMAPAASPGGTPLYHEVKSGETLFRISRVYGVAVTQLKEWNQLRDNTIEVGQRLIVGYQ